MIQIEHLSKCYGSHKAVDDISFTIEDGHIYGFLGPNGAGKSTTMNIITGCLSMTEGTVSVCGHDIFDDPIEAKKCIGYLPEIPPLYIDMTPIEYLSFVARAKGVAKDKIEEEITRAIERSGIENVSDRLIKNLSKGYKQRVGIAQAIIGEPQLVILDEPTVGLDPKQIIEIRDLIKELGEKHTVILSSHILSEVQQVCDKLIIINEGKLVANVDTKDVDGDLEEFFLTLTGEERPAQALTETETTEIESAETEPENPEDAEQEASDESNL